MAIRNSDLFVSFGKELRMTSLLEAKHEFARQSYKRLTSKSLDFSIQRLLVNPIGNLLAVVGSHKVVVVVIPRSSQQSDIPVKASIVGSFYHHERIGGISR